jgi:hypothetical protein
VGSEEGRGEQTQQNSTKKNTQIRRAMIDIPIDDEDVFFLERPKKDRSEM